jgi:sigma-B regulation protein RsbU (phosphoserine phosphatase)
MVIEKVQSFLLMTYTDGVTETRNREDEEFGQDRLMAFFQENKHTNPEELHTRLVHIIDEFRVGNQYADDVTIFSCRVRK